jgi:hypothetical protein
LSGEIVRAAHGTDGGAEVKGFARWGATGHLGGIARKACGQGRRRGYFRVRIAE